MKHQVIRGRRSASVCLCMGLGILHNNMNVIWMKF